MYTNLKYYFWVMAYKIVLEVIYYVFVAPNYSYSGLVWDPSIIKLFISNLCFFLLIKVLPKGQQRPSYQLTQLFFIITVVPVLSIFWQANLSFNYFSYLVVCSLILFIFLRLFKPFRVKFIGFETKKYLNFVNVIFIITCFLLILFTMKFGGIDLRALNFNEIYELRAEAEYGVFWGYLVNWIAKLFIPFCIVMYMIEDKKIMLFISCFFQIYFYLCTGHKSILFSVLFLIVFTFLLKKKKFFVGVPTFYTLAITVSSFLFLITNNFFTIALMPIRQLNIPALLSFNHYDFFSKNPKLYFSEGLIGKVLGLESPYSIHSTFLVSSGGANANTGFLADAYDNGGLLLMILLTIALGVIFLFIDSISEGLNNRYRYTALMLYTIVILNDSALLTTLLTSGGIVLILFLYIVSSEERKKSAL
ncbi:O-antigen polymerase [Bacillus sp. 1NLA3E]|uniref:O-antigen polymerase n=1 Tax=Bacillus sp. 1NLA3E TaxID=666686 RepID=UPI000247E6AC|nr:O-antigen polymerase [Bacillus sp. 1NLA3E]AGK55919.1 WblL protein [Bacillus sp. 1NLA3E]